MVGEVDVGWHEYTNAFELDATVRYGLLTAGGGTSRDTYAASYRWRRTLHTLEVDARTAMRKPPRDAAYYLAKLHFGHRLDVVLKGERHALHGSAGLELLKAGGRFGSATSTGQLQLSVQGAGITVPEQSEILVRTRHDVRKTFREASTPAPILAEYRRIPTACPSSRPGLPAPSRARIRFKEILISEDGCYLRCRWKLTVQCEVNGEQVPDLPEPGEWSRREVDDKSCAPKGRAAEDGCVYPLRWTSRVTLFPGDELECWLDGGVENIDDTPLRSTEALVYKHARPAPVAGTLSRAGEAAYTVPYSINFPSN